MTVPTDQEPRDPPQGDEPRPPQGEEPHGLGEEIRHEIAEVRHEIEEAVEEAVEHVPKPIRWTVGKLFRLAVLSILGLVVIAIVTAILYVANRTEWAAQELALILNQTLASRSDVVLEIGDLKGNPFTGVRIFRPRVRFRDGNAPPLLEAPSLTLRYSAWALATGGRGPIVVDLEQPHFRLVRNDDGRLRLPTWRAGPAKRPGPSHEHDFVLRIHDGSLITPDTTLHIAGLDLEAGATVGAATRVDVRSLRWREGPFGSRLVRLQAALESGDSTRVVLRDLATADLRLHGRAAWKPGADDARLHVEIDRVRWRWLSRVFENGTFDVPGEGHVIADVRGWKRWAGAFRIAANWDSLPLDAHGNLAWDGDRLRLDPLIGTSQAGDLDGAVLWSRRGWEVGGTAHHADPAHWAVLGLHDWPQGDLNGRFRYWVDNSHTLSHPRLAARLTTTEWARWHADSGTVAIDFTPIGPDTFRVRALRRGGEMTLDAVTLPQGWRGDYTLTRFPLDEWPDGRASGLKGTLATGRGTAEDRPDGLHVTGALDGVATDWLGIHTARWRLTDLDGALLPTPNLKATARLADLFFLGVHWDSAAVAFHLGDGTVSLPGLRMAAGDTVMSLDGRVDWGRDGWRLNADRAELESSRFHWTASPPLQLAGDPDGVRFERLYATDGETRLTMEGQWAAAPRGRYDWTARVEALDLSRLGLPMDWGLAGTAEATLRVTGVPGDPHWALEGAAHAPGMQGHRIDSLRVAMGGGPSRVEFSELTALLDGGRVVAHGHVAGMGRAWPDTLTSEGVVHWLAGAGSWDGSLRSDALPLDRLERLVPAAKGWKGRVSGTLDLRGSPGAPDLTWNLNARPLAWGDYRLDGLSAHGRYHDRVLEVPELKMTRGDVASTINGSMPLVLAVGKKPIVPDTPMDWHIHLPSGDLAVLPVFVPQVGSASGRLDVDARLAGTPRHPDLSGHALVREGKVRMAGRDEVIEGVSADLTLDENRITLDSLSGRQIARKGTIGRVTASGAINLNGLALKGYEFTVDMRDFTAIEAGTYVAVFDGRFRVTNGPRIGGTTLPFVESLDNGVELQRAVVLFDFTNQSAVDQVAAATQPLYWTYRIHLNATDKLFWQPENANIEFSADLRIEQTRDDLIINGDMSSLRGTYYYLSNKFTVNRANLTFDNVGGLDPKLDIEAVTQVSRARLGFEPANATGIENITVTVTGRAKEPAITFATDPDPLGQPDVLRALTYGQLINNNDKRAFQEGAKSYADDYFTRAINRQLSADMSRAFQGYISELEFARESGGLFQGGGDVIVRVGVPLSRNATVRYGQRLPGMTRTGSGSGTSPTGPGAAATNPIERDIEAEYRLSRFFYFTTELTQRRATTLPGSGTLPPEFNVNLKARWEY
jgi:hypothetical protein